MIRRMGVRRCDFHLVSYRKTSRRSLSTGFSEPLRILFCGSDEFSIAALQALHTEYKTKVSTIASIDVVYRPPKRVGRGLKTFREVPIASVARELCLPTHELDTFTGWNQPNVNNRRTNLIIAVSFGRLVPARILEAASFGGLNVHPSLLPDFHGPAPLQRTLLEGVERTGVSLQTMHPIQFDQGLILDQTPYPGILHSCSDLTQMIARMAPLGAEMLVRAIRDRLYLPPYQERGWLAAGRSGLSRPAPKITSEDTHVDWQTWTAAKIRRTQRVLGRLWNFAEPATGASPRERRVQWPDEFVDAEDSDVVGGPGVPCLDESTQSVLIRTCDHRVLRSGKVRFDGEKTVDAGPAIRKFTGAQGVNVIDSSTRSFTPSGLLLS